MNASSACITCRKPKASYKCGLCEEPVCKSCASFAGEESFAYQPDAPAELKRGAYCANCFESTVAAPLEEYRRLVEKARGVMVFYSDEGKKTRLVKRPKTVYEVRDCADRAETLMRLAFFAVKDGHNALIDVDLIGEKVTTGRYQTTKWHGRAFPATLDPRKYDR